MQTVINLTAVAKYCSQAEAIPLAKQAGFDGCFIDKMSESDDVPALARLARESGLFVQSVHAPFTRMHEMWAEGSAGDEALAELLSCAQDCADAKIGLMICHVWIGFGEQYPNALGISRYRTLLDFAQEKGVRIAFENTEGEDYLRRAIDDLGSHPAAGFCIDTGHELCYNCGRDIIGLFGEKLVCTHLNDNLGVTGPEIFWHDDAHMLPFDGIANWQGIADRLKKTGFSGPLTFELTMSNKPNRHTHDSYPADPLAFLQLAHERAEKFISLF